MASSHMNNEEDFSGAVVVTMDSPEARLVTKAAPSREEKTKSSDLRSVPSTPAVLIRQKKIDSTHTSVSSTPVVLSPKEIAPLRLPSYGFTTAQIRGQIAYDWKATVTPLFFFGSLAASTQYVPPEIINMYIIGHLIGIYGVAGTFAAAPLNRFIGNGLAALSGDITETLVQSSGSKKSALYGFGVELVQYGIEIGGTLALGLIPKYLLSTPPVTSDETANSFAWGTLGWTTARLVRYAIGKKFTITPPVPMDVDDQNILKWGVNKPAGRILLSASWWESLRNIMSLSPTSADLTENPYFTFLVIPLGLLDELWAHWCFTPDAFLSGMYRKEEIDNLASKVSGRKGTETLVDEETGNALEAEVKKDSSRLIKANGVMYLGMTAVASIGLMVSSAYQFSVFNYEPEEDQSPDKPLLRAIALEGMFEGARTFCWAGKEFLKSRGFFAASSENTTEATTALLGSDSLDESLKGYKASSKK